MGALKSASSKPLQINPIKLSQPMGATLAFLGIDRCMPLMHGGQGCASFTKVYFTRHFSEPIALQTTAVNDVTAVLDGGDYSIVESIKNIRAKVSPDLIGLCTTGLPETKGDDIAGVSAQIDSPLVHVNSADYEGGMESGWANTCKAIIEQLCPETEEIDDNRIVLLPHASMQPIEVEKVKELIKQFGFEVLALPDLSTSLDGHLGDKQASLSSGGITLEQIATLSQATLVISIGASMKPSAAALQQKNPFIRQLHFNHLGGLLANDELITTLLSESSRVEPPAAVIRWRKRLQDAMLDSHFALGQIRFMVAAEADQLASICATLSEAGGRISVALSPVKSPQLEQLKADTVIVGDLEDAAALADRYDFIIGNFHCQRLACKLGKPIVVRGFPNWEQVGNQLKHDLLYEGSAGFLCECANEINRAHMHEDLAHQNSLKDSA